MAAVRNNSIANQLPCLIPLIGSVTFLWTGTATAVSGNKTGVSAVALTSVAAFSMYLVAFISLKEILSRKMSNIIFCVFAGGQLVGDIYRYPPHQSNHASFTTMMFMSLAAFFFGINNLYNRRL